VSGSDFVDREELLKSLIHEIQKNNFIITGARRIGKTSLLVELGRRLKRKNVVVLLDVTKVHPGSKSFRCIF